MVLKTAVLNHLFGVERSFFAGEALNDQTCVLIDENAHLFEAVYRFLKAELIEKRARSIATSCQNRER